MIFTNGGSLSPNGGAPHQLRPILSSGRPPSPPPNAYSAPSSKALEVAICAKQEGRTDMAGCTRPRHPVVVSSAEAIDMATILVSGYGGHPAQGYAGGMGMSCATYGATGVGAGSSPVLEDQLLGTYGDRLQNSSARPAPYRGGYGGGGVSYDDLPLWRVWWLRWHGRFGDSEWVRAAEVPRPVICSV